MRQQLKWGGWLFLAGAMLSPLSASEPWSARPAGHDYSHPPVRQFHAYLTDHYGGYRDVPLDVKAEYFEWQTFRYHLTDFHQVYNRVEYPGAPGVRPTSFPARDTSTWNGALLAALSYKYAVTGEAETLARLAELVRGMHFFFEVTGQPGLMARSIHPDTPLVVDDRQPLEYIRADGRKFYYFGDAAKGGFNQIALGYATLMMLAANDLPPDVRALARRDMHDMVLHMVRHNFIATDRFGKPTTYGNLTPLVGTTGVPFNAQVAYQLVALGYCFPPEDPAELAPIVEAFQRLRGKHHVYYEQPLRSLVLPQRVAASPIVKGMNDRNHVINAAFIGLQLELDQARRQRRPADRRFVYELGQTLVHGMDYLDGHRNALCNFMWAALIADPAVFEMMIERKKNTATGRAERGLGDGVEQLRRFRLERWVAGGVDRETGQVQWCDAFRPDDYHWKCNPFAVRETTGPPTNTAYCAVDYLHAYWLMRYYQLDRHPVLARQNLPVLQATPGLTTWSVD